MTKGEIDWMCTMHEMRRWTKHGYDRLYVDNRKEFANLKRYGKPVLMKAKIYIDIKSGEVVYRLDDLYGLNGGRKMVEDAKEFMKEYETELYASLYDAKKFGKDDEDE